MSFRLWHQLTLQVLDFVQDPCFAQGDGLIKVNDLPCQVRLYKYAQGLFKIIGGLQNNVLYLSSNHFMSGAILRTLYIYLFTPHNNIERQVLSQQILLSSLLICVEADTKRLHNLAQITASKWQNRVQTDIPTSSKIPASVQHSMALYLIVHRLF